MRKWVFLIFLLFVVFGVSGPPGSEASDQNTTSQYDNTGLNLTAEQHEKIQILRENRWKELKPLRSLLFSKFAELKSILTNDSNKAGIKGRRAEVQEEIREIQSKIHEKLTSYRMALRNILTQEQRLQLKALGLERGYFRNGFKSADFSKSDG
jgi:Spy/CpxP family protein refolding chaperone